MGFALGARKSAEKLSDSLVNSPLWVSNRVPTARHFRCFELRGLGQGSEYGGALVPSRSTLMVIDRPLGILYLLVGSEDPSVIASLE